MSDAVPRVGDQDVREQALDTGCSFIVRAPAGSGKTTLLIQRYLALLAKVDEPEEIVAITFTRKAAAEMRERVLEAFAAAGNGATAVNEVTRRLARAVLVRDATREWNLAANASRLRIQTIDSLNASLTRQMPLAARFGAQPEIIDDATALYRDAARAVLAEVNAGGALADDVAIVLAHLDNNLFVAETLLAEMLRARDHWLRNLPRMNVKDVLEAALARVRATALADVGRHFPAELRDETLALVRFASQNSPKSRANAGLSTYGSVPAWPDGSDASLPDWLEIAELLLTQKGTWRKRGGLNKNLGFPPGESKEQKTHFAAAKARMGELLEKLKACNDGARLAFALHRLHGMPSAHYTESQWEVLGAIVRLLPQATAMLWTVFSGQGRCDFTEIALAASRALGEDDAPSDLALALDYRIQHLLVDEFQDTSIAQFELLERLTRGWFESDGRTLFMVGDPMQSIYRFRKAEVEQFQQAAEAGIGGVALNELQLTVNFRSRPAIVDWVNSTFASLMSNGNDHGTGQVAYAASVAFNPAGAAGQAAVIWHPQLVRARKPEGGGVNESATPDPNEQEARAVVEIILAARNGLEGRQRPETGAASIALLVRNRTHLAAIVPALKAANISFRAVDIDPLKERPVVSDLLALTRALQHPADRIAWLAVLRAPWCGLTLNDLAVLAGGAQAIDGALAPDARALWEIMGDKLRVSKLSPDGRSRLNRLWAAIAPTIALCGRRPLRELVESTWLALRGPACLPDPNDLDDVAQLLDLLESEAHSQTGGSRIVDLEQLEAQVDKLYAGNRTLAGGDNEAVQIMTIHKAKGLEFDTVILPGLHRVPRRDDKKLLAWVELPIHASNRHELLLAPIRETGGEDESDDEAENIYRFVQRHEREKQREEEVRLLYVAATRARSRLHLLASITVKSDKGEDKLMTPRDGSLLASLWPAVETVFSDALGAPVCAAAQSAGESANGVVRGVKRISPAQALPQMPSAVAADCVDLAAMPGAPIDFEWAGETARHVGTVVHAFLQRIAVEGLEHWRPRRIEQSGNAFEAELRHLGVTTVDLPDATRRVGEALLRTIADARGRWLLEAHRAAHSEWRLSGVLNDRIINVAIDRTFVDEDGIRWIIDFKTGSHEGGDPAAFLDNEQRRYRMQLESYAVVVRALPDADGPAPIRLGLYFPMLSGWREWNWLPGTPERLTT